MPFAGTPQLYNKRQLVPLGDVVLPRCLEVLTHGDEGLPAMGTGARYVLRGISTRCTNLVIIRNHGSSPPRARGCYCAPTEGFEPPAS